MREKFEKIQELYEEEVSKLDTKHALEIIELITETFIEVKKIHPSLKYICFGMGVWSIEGTVKGVDKQDGEIVEIEDFKDYIESKDLYDTVWVVDVAFNKSCEDLAKLCDYLLDENGLCGSTMLDRIDENGAVNLKI